MRGLEGHALGVSLLVLFLAAVLSPALQAQGSLRYVQTLRSPIRDDAFKLPRAVHADLNTGEVFVCDSFNNRILIFDERGLYRHEIAGGTSFRAPTDVAVDPEGFILTLAVHRGLRGVVQLDFDGQFMGFLELSNLPRDIEPPNLISLALSPAGDRIFLLDSGNQYLWIADRQGVIQSHTDLAADLSDEERLEQVLGNVDVYDEFALVSIPTRGQVQVFEFDGEPVGRVGLKGTAGCHTAFPVAAALDDAGQVIVLDKQRALFMTWQLDGNRCLEDHYGFGNAPGALYQPGDLTLDRSGRVYVSQGFEGRVQVYEGAGSAAFPP